MATQASIDKVNLMYVAYYGRPGDPAGVNFWADVLDVNGGELTASIISAFGTSAEFTDRFGSLSDEELIDNLYLQMFNRTADAEGKAFYLEQIALGNMSLGDAALDIANGAQGSDLTILNNKINVAGYYTEQVDATDAAYGAEHIDAAAAILAAVTDDPVTVVVQKQVVDDTLASQGGMDGETFVLTTEVDSVSGTDGDDLITGILDDSPTGTDTLQVFDNIEGNDGNDTVKVLVTDYSNDIVFPNMSEVENLVFNITSAAAADSNTFDMSLVSGLENLEVHFMAEADDNDDNEIHHLNASLDSLTYSGVDSGTDSSYMGLYINTWNATPIGIQELNVEDLFGDWWVEINGLTNIPVLNLTNVGRESDPDITLEVADSVGTGTDDTLMINAVNAGRMDYTDTNTVDIYLENASTDEDIYENVELSVSGTNGFYLNDDQALSTVTLTGTGDTLLWFSDSDALTTFDGSGHSGDLSSSIDSDQDVTVTLGDGDHWFGWNGDNGTGTHDTALTLTTGSGSTWLSLNGDANESTATVDLGDGNDWLDLWSTNAYNVMLGAGNDVLNLNGTGDLGTADSVDGGAGTDTLIATSAEFADTTALDALSSFEQLIAENAGTYDVSTLAGLTNLIAGGINDVGYGPRYWWDPEASIVTSNNTGNADVVFTGVEAGTTLTLNKDNSQSVTYALADDSGTADAVTVQLGNMDDNSASDDVVIGTALTDGLILSGIETVTINSVTAEGDTADTNTIQELVAGDATTLVITGDADTVINGIELTVNGIGSTAALTVIDASAATGAVTFGEVSDSTNSIQYLGSEGVDTYLGTANGDTINAGSGADAITLGAAGAADTVILLDGDSTAAAMDTYATFVTGEDSIDLGAFGFTGTQASALFAKGAIATLPADGDDDIADFFSSAGVDRAVAWGTNGGNTYVFVDANGDGDYNTDTDLMVELTGIATVALGDFGF